MIIRSGQRGEVAVLDFAGRFTGKHAAMMIGEAFQRLGRFGGRTSIVNLADVRAIDEGALNEIVEWRATLRAAGIDVRLAGPSAALGDREVINRLATHFNMFASVDEALNGAVSLAAPDTARADGAEPLDERTAA